MSEFAPSIESARDATGVIITKGDLPTGIAGAKFSLEEVAKRIREGRLDPRVIGWAGRALMKAGKPRDKHSQAQAILDALREKTIYTPDPTGAERITAAKYTLCLDELGLCMPAADCDDLSVALGSAFMSVGLPTQIVAQAFDGGDAPSHVLVAVETESGWERADPSSSKYKVGEYFTATKEWWFDPLKEIRMDDQGRPIGDFVGVGAPPPSVAAATERPIPNVVDALNTAYERYYHQHAGPTGLGQFRNVLFQIPNTPTLTEEQKTVIYDTTTLQMQAVVSGLDIAVTRLEKVLTQLDQVRKILRPNQPYDTEINPPVTMVAQFPDNGVWTKNMNEISWWLVSVGKKFVSAGKEALNGGRRIIVDPKTQDAYVEAKDSDSFRLNNIRKADDLILAFVSPAGAIITGLVASDGQVLTKEETERELLAARGAGLQTGLGVGPLVVIAILVTAAVVSYLAMRAFEDWCHAAEVKAYEATNLEIARAGANGTFTPAQTADAFAKLRGVREAQAEIDKAKSGSDPFANLVKALGMLAVGGAVVGTAYLLHPIVKAAAENWQTKRTAGT